MASYIVRVLKENELGVYFILFYFYFFDKQLI